MRYCSRRRSPCSRGERFCPVDGGVVVEAAEAAADPLIGRTLAGRYLLARALGKGGMGVRERSDLGYIPSVTVDSVNSSVMGVRERSDLGYIVEGNGRLVGSRPT